MGGFILTFPERDISDQSGVVPQWVVVSTTDDTRGTSKGNRSWSTSSINQLSTDAAREADKNGHPSFPLNSNSLPTDAVRVANNRHPPFPVSADQVLVLAEEFLIEIPYITQNDIMDRSKSDPFTKIFAIGQSSWLIFQCITRIAQSLPRTGHYGLRRICFGPVYHMVAQTIRRRKFHLY